MDTRQSVLLLVMFATLTAECYGNHPLKLKSLGCFKKDPQPQPKNSKPFFNARNLIVWKDMCARDNLPCNFTTIVQKCAQKALENKHDIFGVHFYGECWANHEQLTKDSSSKCYGSPSVGSDLAGAVYQIEKNCVGGHLHGSSWYTSLDVNKCKHCKCNLGLIQDCNIMTCNYYFGCEKYNPAVKGMCCRTCACHHNGVDKTEGEEWTDNRSKQGCRECRCLGGKAKCGLPQKCKKSCYKPQYVPGKCCPVCTPKAPTTRPWETIPPTRAPPVLPPWIPRPPPHGKKRSVRSKRRYPWKLTRQ